MTALRAIDRTPASEVAEIPTSMDPSIPPRQPGPRRGCLMSYVITPGAG